MEIEPPFAKTNLPLGGDLSRTTSPCVELGSTSVASWLSQGRLHDRAERGYSLVVVSVLGRG